MKSDYSSYHPGPAQSVFNVFQNTVAEGAATVKKAPKAIGKGAEKEMNSELVLGHFQTKLETINQPWPTQIGSRAKFLKNCHLEGQNLDFFLGFSRFDSKIAMFQKL
jgi:hypothetical protein